MSEEKKDSAIRVFAVKLKGRIQRASKAAISHPLHILKNTFIVTGGLVWFGLLLLAIYFYSVFSNVPDLEDVEFQKVREVAVESVQEKIDSKTKRKEYKWVRIDNINRDLLYSIVMSEDGQFFTHSGVNWDALMNAIGENIKRRKFSYGASTITQQVAKNVYLRSNTKSLHRKFTELFVTRELEQHLSKNEILEMYLNVAEFGPDIYGVAHASKYYFNKKPSEINAAEGAFLAVMLPSPRKYHYSIFKNKYLSKRHKKKLKRILADMLYKEYISPKQYRRYLNWNYFTDTKN
jgi:monofunctional biosynthetic peptidoglycan transglycosylase